MWYTLFVILHASGISSVQESSPYQFAPPERITSSGEPIDVTVGHAAPYLQDFDGDGIRDLLVGEFGKEPFPQERLPESYRSTSGKSGGYAQGRLRIYKNYGSEVKPEYRGYEYLKAGDEFASIPST